MAIPLLTPMSDDVPCPRVVVLVSSLPSSAVTATLFRWIGTDEGSARREEVRGAFRVSVAGVLSVVDFEVPLDVDVAYQAALYNAAGNIVEWTDAASTMVVSPRWNDGRRRVLVQNPLDPRTAMWVQFGGDAASSVVKPTPGQVVWPEGRRLGLVQGGRRRGMVGVPLDFVTETYEDRERFDALFGTAETPRMPILCIRIPRELYRTGLPPVWFAAVLEPTAVHRHWSDEVLWRIVADEVAPPVPTLVTPALRRADIAAYYGSRQAVRAGNSSRLALSRRFEIAGS
ncbi:hypothetical protein L332_03640 [Agrococcus pavilionensis RW1]|uniref:Uncharacterized protein n=1 Tax=Agrococcus pavilionensis RW1 TaxID=1330458 RepID=U1LMH2_9MICO|nr:hypothetical protein [Agrococcus pavilionensis]ERG63544.1 hypothetical protein L332_03640 [Agrococcus pavilionensis RW1]